MKPTLLALAVCATAALAATPAEIAIRQSVESIQKQPDHYPYYNALAAAYARRARETASAQYYVKADDALQKSLALAPGNFDGLKVKAWLQLGRHEFRAALELATTLNKTAPDDLAVYGYLVDANVALGNYKDAVNAAQWMLNLRPGNVPALARAAYLRELHGNLSGALELLETAYDSLPPAETEDRAWMLVQVTRVELLAGDASHAETHANEALALFPDYPDGLEALANVRLAQARFSEAVTLLQQRYDAAPRTDVLYALAEAQERAGQHEASLATFVAFETQAEQQSSHPDNCNRELANYYADHDDPAKALVLARREAGLRQDVFTLDAYAWALAANGDAEAAGMQMQKALALGTKDPRLLLHSAAIALRLQQARAASQAGRN